MGHRIRFATTSAVIPGEPRQRRDPGPKYPNLKKKAPLGYLRSRTAVLRQPSGMTIEMIAWRLNDRTHESLCYDQVTEVTTKRGGHSCFARCVFARFWPPRRSLQLRFCRRFRRM